MVSSLNINSLCEINIIQQYKQPCQLLCPHLLDLGWQTDVLGPLLGRVELVSPPGLGEGGQRGAERGHGRGGVRPLEVEEGVLEAVGGDLGGGHSTLQCSTVQYSTVQYSTVQYSTV